MRKRFTILPIEIQELLNQAKEGYINILKDELVGIYIHGSLAMGCFNPKSSDIDFLVVVREKLDLRTKEEIIGLLLELSEIAPAKGLEMSIILQSELDNLKYPTPFELHYGDVLKEKYENDPGYMCGDDEDPDLVAHITVTINRGFCLYGEPIKKVFKPVPELYYIDALIYDLEDVEKNIISEPAYNILNLCRVLQYLEEKRVSSKVEGGQWALKTGPGKFRDIIKSALASYQESKYEIEWGGRDLVNFAEFMMGKINAKLKGLPEMKFRS